jgi:hypothetical protein
MIAGHLGEILAVVATSDPSTHANTEKFSDAIDMSKFDQVIGIALTGDMASETIDFKVYKCDSDGSNRTALKSATQLAANASANDNSQIVIAVRASDLNANSEAARYITFGLVTGGATGGVASIVALGLPVYGIAASNDLATVKQIVF